MKIQFVLSWFEHFKSRRGKTTMRYSKQLRPCQWFKILLSNTGVGEPFFLLHGGLGQIEMFGACFYSYSGEKTGKSGVDLHGHGRTALGDRKINLIDIGNDLAEILTQLGYKRVNILGYSMGGGVALRLAVRRPEKCASLGHHSRAVFYPEMLPQQEAVSSAMAEAMKETPMYKSYVAIAPKPKEFPELLDRMGELIRTSSRRC